MATKKKVELTEEELEEIRNYNGERRIKFFFFTELLGSCPSDPEVYREYIASKEPNSPTIEEEASMLPTEEVIEKGRTVFLRRKSGSDAGKPCIASYTILGFQKEKSKYLKNETNTSLKFKDFTNYKQKIDGNYAIDLPFITLNIPEGEELGICERPLRAETAKGARVALSSSESCPPGTTCEFNINIFAKEFMKYAMACFHKGFWNGMCQWRSGGKGRFLFEAYDSEGNMLDGNTKKYVGCTSEDKDWSNKFNQFLDRYRI